MKLIDLHSDVFTDIAFRREKGERHVFERVHLPNLQRGGVSGIIGVFGLSQYSSTGKKYDS